MHRITPHELRLIRAALATFIYAMLLGLWGGAVHANPDLPFNTQRIFAAHLGGITLTFWLVGAAYIFGRLPWTGAGPGRATTALVWGTIFLLAGGTIGA